MPINAQIPAEKSQAPQDTISPQQSQGKVAQAALFPVRTLDDRINEHCYIEKSLHSGNKIKNQMGSLLIAIGKTTVPVCDPIHFKGVDSSKKLQALFVEIPTLSQTKEQKENKMKKCGYANCKNGNVNSLINVRSKKYSDETLFQFCSQECLFKCASSWTLDKISKMKYVQSQNDIEKNKKTGSKRKKKETDDFIDDSTNSL